MLFLNVLTLFLDESSSDASMLYDKQLEVSLEFDYFYF